jgi:hypothetical protein
VEWHQQEEYRNNHLHFAQEERLPRQWHQMLLLHLGLSIDLVLYLQSTLRSTSIPLGYMLSHQQVQLHLSYPSTIWHPLTLDPWAEYKIRKGHHRFVQTLPELFLV